jgi:hypothetical protein
MTTIHRPAQGIPLKRGTQTRAGSMQRLATLQIVPRELRPFQVRLDGPGQGLDGWAVVERLLKDLAPLDDRLWLVIKLGVHNRHEAVDRARALGLLAPSARRA